MKFNISEKRLAGSIEKYILKNNLLCQESTSPEVSEVPAPRGPTTPMEMSNRLNLKLIHNRIDFDTRFDNIDDDDDIFSIKEISFILGYGKFKFEFEGNTLYFCKHLIGDPVSSVQFGKETAIHEDIYILFDESKEASAETKKQVIMNLLKLALQDIKCNGFIKSFTWHANGEFFKEETLIPSRDFSTVILDSNLKDSLISDVEEFLSDDTKQWYKKHGIPYRRGYLFSGPPGTAKTSTILAIATKFNKSIYKINLVNPGLSDSGLICAMNMISKDAIVVFEDIDAVFDEHRTKRENSEVTFSGLLNCLDGFSSASRGQLSILTTNFPEKLDLALIRKGRVDNSFEFKFCSDEQAREMFLSFYPNSNDDANKFAKLIPKNSVSTAEMQSHFIYHRKSSSSEASNFDISKVSNPKKKVTERMSMFA